MNPVKSSEDESVANLFHSMTMLPKQIHVFSKSLMDGDFSEHKGPPKESILILNSDKDSGEQVVHCELEVSLDLIEKLLSSLEAHKDEVIMILVKCKYTWNNASLVFNKLIGSIDFCKNQFKTSPCSFKSVCSFINCSKDVLSVVQNVAESFFSGGRTYLLCSESDELFLFYCVLARISKISGFGDRLSVWNLGPLPDLKSSNGLVGDIFKELLMIYNAVSTPYPVIVTEDADISASADCISKSICQNQIQESFSVSHIFIQESVFKQTVSTLKDRLNSLNHGIKLVEGTEVLLEENEMVHKAPEHTGLEIFTPCEKSPIKLCIGWNPKDIDADETFSKANGYLVVLPYRNVAEVKSLIKENIKQSGPVAIWSERINVLNMQLDHEFSMVWINCHGYTQPLTFSNAPYNVLLDKKILEVGAKHLSSEMTKEQINSYIVSKSSELQEVCRKGYLDWQKRSTDVQMKLLDLLQKFDCENCHKSWFNQRASFGGVSSYVSRELKVVSPKVHSTSSVKPVGTVLIFCDSPHPMSERYGECLRRVVISALLNGNSVVIGGDKNLIPSCKKCLEDLQWLPSGVLNFQLEPSYYMFLVSSGRVHPCFGIFLFMKPTTLDVVDYCYLNKHFQISLDDCFCDEVLTKLTTTAHNTCIA